MQEISLLSVLNGYGDIIELDYKFNSQKCISDLKKLKWIPSTHGKNALNLTGPMDDIGLGSRDKHVRNQPYNDNLYACGEIKTFFDNFEQLARCRAVQINAGTFFKLHRDAYKLNPQFRIFIPLNGTETHEWCFVYDDQLIKFKSGVPYILNTRKVHGSFSFIDDIYHVLMSVYLTERNVKTIAGMLPNCMEY